MAGMCARRDLGETRTHDLSIGRRALYHCAIAAHLKAHLVKKSENILHHSLDIIMIIDSAEKVQCDMIYDMLWSIGEVIMKHFWLNNCMQDQISVRM